MIELSSDASETEAYAAAQSWIRDHLPEQWRVAVDAADWKAVDEIKTDDQVTAEWYAALGDAGLATPRWPHEYGGLDLSGEAAGAITAALAEYRADRPSEDFVGLALAGATIMAHGSAEQKQRFLGPLARGEHRWCQLFSEPGAGSDLAGLSTRAELQSDGSWLINGQKVWSSYAHMSDFGLLMARTDPTLPKHQGITYFLVDMTTIGVDPRPLKQMTGNAEFNEVFLTDVVLPPEALIGAVNGGWSVAITTLMQERSGLTGRPSVGEGRSDELLRRAVSANAGADPLLRDRLLRLVVEERALQMTTVRAHVETGRGAVGAEGSIRKIVNATIEEEVGTLAAEVEPMSVLAWPEGGAVSPAALDFLAMKTTSIAGGTSEIQRNIIAERVLGLPKDPDPDRHVPFNQRARG